MAIERGKEVRTVLWGEQWCGAYRGTEQRWPDWWWIDFGTGPGWHVEVDLPNQVASC